MTKKKIKDTMLYLIIIVKSLTMIIEWATWVGVFKLKSNNKSSLHSQYDLLQLGVWYMYSRQQYPGYWYNIRLNLYNNITLLAVITYNYIAQCRNIKK